jgi:hypothetical protein
MIEESNVECIYKTAAILAPSLGPCGMDKLLVDDKGDIHAIFKKNNKLVVMFCYCLKISW